MICFLGFGMESMKREMESNNFAKKKGQNSSFIKEDGSKRF